MCQGTMAKTLQGFSYYDDFCCSQKSYDSKEFFALLFLWELASHLNVFQAQLQMEDANLLFTEMTCLYHLC